MEKSVLFFMSNILFSIVSSLELSYTIPEEKAVGYYIGNVANDSQLTQTLNDSERNNMKYTILDRPYASYFNVNERTSSLFIDKKLDRESLQICEFSVSCDLQIDIVAQSTIGTFFRKVKVTITITDINDHPPKFSESTLTLELSEAFVVGSSSPLEGAVDADSGNNSVQEYYLQPTGTPFTLDHIKNVDGSSSVSIVVSKKLDRESVDSYQLKIMAEDGGNPKRTGTLHLNIIITDVNDNPPSFNQSTYAVSVNEGRKVGTVIFNVKAIDPDLNENGKVTYKLSPHQSDNIKQIFGVNSSSGDIYTLQQLAYTPSDPYRVIVEANDGAAIPLMSQATIFVTVLDSDNDPPTINVNLLSNTDVAKISENASVGAAVAHIAVSDDDTDKNGEVQCSIKHDAFRLEIIEKDEYKVVVSKSLDRETTEQYKVVIYCQDGGTPSKNSTAEFEVKVLDENDHRPTFLKSRYDVTLDENDFVGAHIVKVSALDLDIGSNSDIVYSINSSDYGFIIDQVTHDIYANFVLDRETVPFLEFRVLAEDKGTPSLTGSALITLTLMDINDNAPKFNKSVYTMYAKENESKGYYVGEVIAYDPDIGKNGEIKFYSDPEILTDSPFEVLLDGSIFSTGPMDRETRPHGYSFNIVVFDHGNPTLNSTAHVTIFILDENDNSPVIRFPVPENGTIKIVYEKPTNSVITYVDAIDRDTGVNALLTYSLVQTEMLRTFKINSNTGEITLARALSSNDMRSYTFTIQVEDGGVPKRRDRQNLTVIISSNAPLSIPRTEPEKDNALIVIIIVCVTIILSGTIILIIFLIRRKDRKKKNKTRKNAAVHAKGEERDMYDSIHKNGSVHKVDLDHNEKRVSFSRSTMANGNHDRIHIQRSNGPPDDEDVTQINDRMTKSSYLSSQEKLGRSVYSGHGPSKTGSQNFQMTRLQLHQSNLHSLSIPNGHVFTRKHEDNHSETSGETNDSGRGGSESDIHSNGCNQILDLDYYKNRCSPINSPGRPLLTKENVKFHQQHKERYKPQPQHYLGQNSHNYRPRNPGNGGLQHKQNSVHWNPISDVLNGSMATIDDYDDDTTTSGSYVVDEQELDLEFVPQDCVV